MAVGLAEGVVVVGGVATTTTSFSFSFFFSLYIVDVFVLLWVRMLLSVASFSDGCAAISIGFGAFFVLFWAVFGPFFAVFLLFSDDFSSISAVFSLIFVRFSLFSAVFLPETDAFRVFFIVFRLFFPVVFGVVSRFSVGQSTGCHASAGSVSNSCSHCSFSGTMLPASSQPNSPLSSTTHSIICLV